MALTAIASAQSPQVFRVKGTVGQSATYASVFTITIDADGEKVDLKQEGTSQSTIKAIAANGNFTFESKTLTSKVSIMGEELPADEEDTDAPNTLVVTPRGQLLEYKDPEVDLEDPDWNLSVRLYVASTVIFPEAAIAPGAKWSQNIAADEKLGTVAAKIDYEYLRNTTVNGVACAEFKVDYAEAGGMKSTQTVTVEIATGDPVKSEAEINGLELTFGEDKMKATAKASGQRTGGGFLPGQAAVAPAEAKPAEAKPAEAKPAETKPAEKPADEKDAIADKVKDFTKLDGLFTLYRRDRDGRMTLYMEIKPEQFNRLALLQTTLSTGMADGTVTAGDPVSDLVFEFRRLPNNRIAMFVPNYRFRAEGNAQNQRNVARSFAESLVESFSIEAEHKGRILIDVSELFRGDIGRVASLMQGGGNPFLGGGGASYSLDRQNTYVEKIKTFPNNVTVYSVYNFAGRGGGGAGIDAIMSGGGNVPDDRSVVLKVNYNLWMLPTDNGYRPRVADPRVGYFTSDFTDFSDLTARNNKRSLINRWHLVKKDPNAPISDVVEPIVFWVDNATPERYRAAVKRGIESWNKAFEAAGFRGAIVARQMPDDADWDHADMRYNVVRWVTSPEQAYAIALFRVNPITGQIVNASVTIDAGIVRFFAGDYRQLIRPDAVAHEHENGHKCSDPTCNVQHAVRPNLAVGLMAVDMLQGSIPGISRDAFIEQFIFWLVAHEVGHTLGLRHNFVSSTELSLADMRDPAKVDQFGTSSSVMDYVPFNPEGLRNNRFYGQTVGTYDIWAIQYGYREIPNTRTTEDEIFALKQHASQGNRRGLQWQGDEFADGVDPRVTRFDLTKNPYEYWERMASLTRHLLFNLDKHSPKPGEPFSTFTNDFQTLAGMYVGSSNQLLRYVGGVRKNPNFRGDANEQMPILPIPVAEQRRALQTITRNVFAPSAMAFPRHYYRMMQEDASEGLALFLSAPSNTFPMLDALSNLQNRVLNGLMSPSRLTNVANQEFEAMPGEETLGLAELYRTVGSAVWSELGREKEFGTLRRQLQRTHVDTLIAIYLGRRNDNAEARTMAWYQLIQLRDAINKGLAVSNGTYTSAHLRESVTKINRALNAVETLGQSAARAPSLLDLLMGGGATPAPAKGKSGK